MNKVALLLTILLISGCGTTSKKLKDLPPLAADAPVEVFYSTPNVKYEVVCEIEAKGNNSLGGMYREKEDFAPMFKEEARKCGADGVIFKFLSGYQSGSVTAYATGVKILGGAAALSNSDQIKAFSLAIQSHDLAKVKEILAKVPKAQSVRAPSDDELVNLGLYIAILDGLRCDAKIVKLLEKEYGARVTKFAAINMIGSEKSDADTPLCENVMARSLPRMEPLVDAIVKVNNHYVSLLEYTASDLDKKAAKFEALLTAAAKIIADSCKKSSTDPICAMKNSYKDFAEKTKPAKSAALRKNANAVLRILK